MLPTIDPVTLSANPKFSALYQELCSNALNTDGSSKLDEKTQRDRNALKEDLRKARVETAQRDLIKGGLQDLSYRGSELPEDLQELVGVVAALLDGQISEEDKELLQDDLMKFKDDIKSISTALSKHFQRDGASLAVMLEPENPPTASKLSSVVGHVKESISTSRSSLYHSRLSLGQEASKVHDLYRQIIEASIRILEQTIHGSVARGTKAKADYLAVVAEGMSKKLNMQHYQLMSQIYSPEMQDALSARLEQLQRESRTMTRKTREADERLDDYRQAGGMEHVAEEFADILKETEKVKADIARLEGY